MKHTLIHGDCLDVLRGSKIRADCIFADPPDNIGLGYPGYDDKRPGGEYLSWLAVCLRTFIRHAPIVWLSYNAKWTYKMGSIVEDLYNHWEFMEVKPCVQTYTFYQHNKNDPGNAHRPIMRIRANPVESECLAPIYPDQIRVPSWRQLNGDKRADPRGKVPGDVFEFPRVTGNSKQRRRWSKTQLHEGLVERCIRLSTPDSGEATVIDPFGGTGTTLRVCKRIGRQCTLIEQSLEFCEEIAKEHDLDIEEYED